MPTVLIADDSPTIRGFVRLALRGLDVELVEAEDGAQALELARKSPPSLVLLDVNMPVLDGLAATRALRADPDPALSLLPIYLLTAERSEQVRAQCLAAGASGILDKPLRITELKETVAKLLAQHPGAGPGAGSEGGGRE